MSDRDVGINFAIKEANKFLSEAEDYLNEKYGEDFSSKNPDLIAIIATLYAISFQTFSPKIGGVYG